MVGQCKGTLPLPCGGPALGSQGYQDITAGKRDTSKAKVMPTSQELTQMQGLQETGWGKPPATLQTPTPSSPSPAHRRA